MSWVVLKFGGTSVSTAPRWRCICQRVQSIRHHNEGRVWVVISALTQVTNRLTTALDEAVTGTNHLQSYLHIFEQHLKLAAETELITTSQATHAIEMEKSAQWAQPCPTSLLAPLVQEFHHLRRVLDGIRLTEEASPRLRARVLAFGELLSTHLGLEIMKAQGLSNVTRVDARQLLQADTVAKSEIDKYLEANVRPKFDTEGLLEAACTDASVVLTQGFIAGVPTATGFETCVLGRGGSDTSGALFAALLKASRYEIWTDVHGMYTSDPRFVPHARLIKRLDYREAQELAAMGAKVLHPRCIGPAHWANVPVEIRNTNDPDGEKTVIGHLDDDKCAKIMAVVRRMHMTLVTITAYDMCGTSGFLSKVFLPFEQLGISVDLIATSQFSVSVTLDHIPGGVSGSAFTSLVEALEKLGAVSVVEPCATVSVVGRHLRTSLGELGPVFQLLEGYEVLLLSESAEDLNLSFVVTEADADALVTKMHAALFPPMQGERESPGLSYLKSPSRDALLGSSYSVLLSSPRGFTL
ncbi:aspartokinase [Thraustotheca clavata]|uniref:Aspartokinase n=1 Tax=Thraustotheca clavata TaxID=74557 RepID=A0A1V9Y6N8_9STRA|nr:aspartokinase [Thraustotheca clavata]